MFSEAVRELQSGWEQYRSGAKTNKDHPMHHLVLYRFKEIVEEWLPNKEKFLVKGSDGQGNILRTPWVAIMDREVTTTATEGYYLVYLFDDALERMYLEIGFGAYQFERKFGSGTKYFEALDNSVKDMQDSSDYLLERISSDVRNRIFKSRPSLDSQGDFKLRSYERCSIYCLEYNLQNSLSDALLQGDFTEMLKLYGYMAGSLLLADAEDYVVDSAETPQIEEDFSTIEFQPRVFKKRQSKEGSSSSGSRRYSKKSDKVGKLGEEFVYNFERKILIQAGQTELADRVIWHRQDSTNRTPGWDITSYDTNGRPKLIEVKASSGKTISDVVLTTNELAKMQEYQEEDNYFLYLVSNIIEKPVIEVLRNPAKYISQGSMSLSVESYLLRLGVVEN